jgi:hypothetical protein
MSGHDEFRVRVQTAEAKRLVAALREAHVGERERALLGRVATTREGDHVFLYADSEDVARTIAAAVRQTMSESSINGELTVSRWHPLEERWEDASMPLPSTPEEIARERERLEDLEDAESRARGYDEWEVRATLPSHADAKRVEERLASEGLSLRRHWRHLIIGAEDEVTARELAARVEAEEPGCETVVEGAGMPVWELLNPYSIFGGLGT